MSRYLVPAETTEVETRAGNSRFLSVASRVRATSDVHDQLRDRRQTYPQANHHVYAFKVGYAPSVTEGMSDDGEPTGTSGPPTLAVLRGRDVGDCLVITTRFFGGTKLGTGGLVAAYTAAAQAVLDACPFEEKIDRTTGTLNVPYPQHDAAKRLLTRCGAEILVEDFAAHVTLRFRIAIDDVPMLQSELREQSQGSLQADIDPHDS